MTVVVLVTLILLADRIGFFNGMNNYFYDLYFRLRGPEEPAKNIVIIAIDGKTLKDLGRWPIRRLYYASLLKRLKEANTVAFDIMMAEPSADDAALEESVREQGRVVFPAAIDDNMAVTYPAIPVARDRVGHIHVEQGIDGVVREVYHTLFYKNGFLPSFSSVIFENATGIAFRRTMPGHFQGQVGRITQSDGMTINYCGGPGTFERISFTDVLAGMYPPSFSRNKICFVGVTATGAGEILLTPFSQERRSTPGVEVQANILSNLLLGNAIRVVPYWIGSICAIFLVLLSFLCFLHLSELRTAVLLPLMLLCLAAITYALFSVLNVWLAPSAFFLTILSVFFVSYAFKFNEAVARLDRAYAAALLHLRWHGDQDGQEPLQQGMRALLTPGGVYSKAQVLGNITEQLIFEKQLTDTAVFSDVQGVLLFGPGRTLVLANNLSAVLCEENFVDIRTVDTFLKNLASLVLDKVDIGDIAERLYSGEHRVTFNVSFPAPKKKFFKLDASPLTIQDKRYPLFVFSDITTLKELEILKSHVVSLVSHEIKTPLLSIEGFSEMLRDSLEGEMKEYAVIVQKESARLIRFLDTFLDISRIEGGQQPIRMEPVMLSDTVKEAVYELKAFAEERGITISAETPEEISRVMIDRDLTKQCFINLIENGIKYSQRGKVVTARLVEEVDHVRIDIIDHGIGIREEEVDLVFDKFYRGHSDDTREIQGSGLGLTFVKEAVGAQGGKVSVESRYGEGSKFSILFPKTLRGMVDEEDPDRR